MHLRHLQLTDFRSWPRLDMELEAGPIVLVGPNGTGKTNIVEAIGYLATLGSHRVATDAPLVRHECDRALVRAAVASGDRELVVELEIAPGRSNRSRVNRAALSRPRDVLGIVHTVLFAPEDLALVKGDPEQRRRFLDDLLVQRFPSHAGVRADYDKALRQRNALLKTLRSGSSQPYGTSTLDVWDSRLAELGGPLLVARLELVAQLAPRVRSAYAEIADGGGVGDATGGASVAGAGTAGGAGDRTADLRYESTVAAGLGEDYGSPRGRGADVDIATKALHEAISRSRHADIDRGASQVGPHRDELNLTLGGTPMKGYASHGESWSLALALRLGSYELLRSEMREPVLILDDVFAELDRPRRSRLAAVAAGAEQVFVTAAVADDIPPELHGPRYAVSADGVARG